ncbi:unnamed protein product [Brassica oleracea var. botrytis]|uniref:(rape) hypothetical protein n=1 Tax=Brassica napus TaxID=3708 RepID=A0A816U242_BRANA|nr:unnamed protein product [Brassica napus]
MKKVEIFMISLCSNTALFLVSADPQTCPAESGAKCSGSGDWEGDVSMLLVASPLPFLMQDVAHAICRRCQRQMDSFEKQFVNMEVQAEFMENAMAGSTSLSTPEGDVNHLMQQLYSTDKKSVPKNMEKKYLRIFTFIFF